MAVHHKNNCLVTTEKLVITLAVNRLTCCELLCTLLHNSFHYCYCYRKHMSEDDIMFTKIKGSKGQ